MTTSPITATLDQFLDLCRVAQEACAEHHITVSTQSMMAYTWSRVCDAATVQGFDRRTAQALATQLSTIADIAREGA